MKIFLKKHLYVSFLLEAIILTTLIELMSRKSIPALVSFIAGSHITFLCNVFIVFMTLSLSMLAGSYRSFAQAAISIIWVILGLVNAIVLRYRMTPFSAEDFTMIPSLLRIANHYLTIGTLFLIVGMAAAILAAFVVLWKKLPKESSKTGFIKLTGRTAMVVIGCYAFLSMGMQTQALSTSFMNLADAYEEYGFAYCFSTSIVDVGIDKPDSYGEELMQSITNGMIKEETAEDASSISAFIEKEVSVKTTSSEESSEQISEAEDTGVTQSRPNIIMIQLESFFDPTLLKHFTYSTDPVPNFRSIKENFASGFFTVPVVGAGTANSEFEILTGMSSDYFGAGEYPYNTVLKSTVVEAIPHILRPYGYTSTAMHNNTGTFYNRNLVFANMGFDNFIPEEYMYDMGTTATNWHTDAVFPQIMEDVMEESDGPDFIYAITVQSHGRYPSSYILEDPVITVSGDEEASNIPGVEYYVNMVYEVDQMIADLIDRLLSSDEPTVLIMYGDHLPALGFGEEDIDQESLYMTEYVIWDNFSLSLKNQAMQAESIGTYILQQFGMDSGIMNAFHETYDNTDEYSTYLESMEYDMLYGEGFAYDSFGIHYTPSDMLFSYRPISVTSTKLTEDGLYVYGENFNESTRVIADESICDTEYIDQGTLLVRKLPKKITRLQTGQFDENLKQLGKSTASLYGVLRGEPETE